MPLLDYLRRSQVPPKGSELLASLGVRPLINAAGTYTALTASLPPAEVGAAMSAVAGHFVDLQELQVAAGRRVAELLRCEAALITSGAAAALTLGTAACLTGGNPELIQRLPVLDGMKSEVIIQRSHRYPYDHAVRNCGVTFIEIETAEELKLAVKERTAMMLFFNDADPRGRIKAEEFVALGKELGIPTFNDAAADVPPVEHLWRYTQMGFDLVTFSGGKGLRGPQGAGLLLGRKDLIEAARFNTAPHSDSIGRGMKASKEATIGLLVALELYLERDHAADAREWMRRAELIANTLSDIDELTVQIHIPPIANHVPHIRLEWEQARLGLSGDDARARLRAGDPPIEIVPAAPPLDPTREEIQIGVWQLQEGEVEIVARRLREILTASSSTAS
jgi:uncharacterized pyridoxal phosphate-dependent enzyme